MQKYILLFLIFLTPGIHRAQTFNPRSPVDIPIVLSGTFAELRGNHFHGGIDIKTQGRSGLNIYAVADGYVSRIAVSPYGYGNAIYIRHPEGYTSVYGHVNAFSPEIEKWVEEQLRDKNKNDGNLYPSSNQFVVKLGDVIALSGNTGGSSGPHLHFEIRDTRTEEPLNPLEFGLEVKDTRKPDVRGLAWTDKDFITAGTFKSGDTIVHSNPIGIDLLTTDKQDAANNNNGVYAIKALADGQTFFTAHYQRINFSTTRYLNAHINFDLYCQKGVRYTRLYELENNPLKITTTSELTQPGFEVSKGWISVTPDSVVKIEVAIADYAGNTSEVVLYVRGSSASETISKGTQWPWDFNHEMNVGPITVKIPAKALYKTDEFEFSDKGNGQYVIGAGVVALQSYMTLNWTLDSSQIGGQGWFMWEYDHRGRKSAITGNRSGNTLVFKTRSTGTYELDQDLTKPQISLTKYSPYGRSNSTFNEIRLTVKDDKTGIERYSAKIDGKFARIDYDYKSSLFKVIIPKDTPPGSHKLEIVAIDGVGNTTEKDFTITL